MGIQTIKAQESETRQEAELYSLISLAKRWDTSYRNLHRKVLEGKLRVIRLGPLIRVTKKEVARVEQYGF